MTSKEQKLKAKRYRERNKRHKRMDTNRASKNAKRNQRPPWRFDKDQ